MTSRMKGTVRTPLGCKGGVVQGVEDFAQGAHVAREAPLQVTRGFRRHFQAAQFGAQRQCLELFVVVQLANREHRRRRQPRLEVLQLEVDVRRVLARREQQRRVVLLRPLPQGEHPLLPGLEARDRLDVVETGDVQGLDAVQRAGPERQQRLER
jgi:hypothetical protein